jgi:hypothetical protein
MHEEESMRGWRGPGHRGNASGGHTDSPEQRGCCTGFPCGRKRHPKDGQTGACRGQRSAAHQGGQWHEVR